MHSAPLSTAVAGIGGFGTAHHNALFKLEQTGHFRVKAACDPALGRLGDVVERLEFARRGVDLYEAFEPMMERHGDDLQLLTVAAPIPLHAPMHQAAVERGISCYLEKPPTLDPQELEEMIARDANARHATQVGFNYIYQSFRHDLKERILSGEFGRLLRVGYIGLWPRSLRYYRRNGWAGRLMLDNGYVVLDSCCGNAMSHHLHNILFFAGSAPGHSWARPARLEAELYRANTIQGTDTVFARGTLENDVEIRLVASHACEVPQGEEILTCEDAEIRITIGGEWTILRDGKVVETHPAPTAALPDNFMNYANYVRGVEPRPQTLLEDCRAFVEVNALLYVAAGRIQTIPETDQRHLQLREDDDETVFVPNITAVCKRAIQEGSFPSEQGLPWAAPGGSAMVDELSRLRSVLSDLAASQAEVV